ncbi:MAG: RnfH family protein [Gammaproteobacteria bacterium]|nr:MAG: RnfH family protein [Gammaproteobacteria bacterium]
MANQLINIEVAYATPERQKIIACQVPAGTSLLEAAKLSGISDIFLELDLDTADFGIWGKTKPGKTPVEEGQRIEIYRPLLADPKESRRKRAEKRAREK